MYGPDIGYLPKAANSVLIVKSRHFEQAELVFQESSIRVTKTGERHLEATTGMGELKDSYI